MGMKSNDDAMAIAGIAFGVFCLFVVIVGVLYVIGVSSQQAPTTDTFGQTLDPTSNQSQQIVTSTTTTSSSAMVPILLIVGTILLIAVLVAFWIFSKTGIHL